MTVIATVRDALPCRMRAFTVTLPFPFDASRIAPRSFNASPSRTMVSKSLVGSPGGCSR